jgi:hypothetical protein
MPNACRKVFGAALVGIVLLSVSPASAQKITLGVIAGASLTDDFRNTSITSGEGGLMFGEGSTLHLRNASQWFMFGPTVDVAFSKRLSVEVEAIRRRIRSTGVTILATPVEYPGGITIGQFPYPILDPSFARQKVTVTLSPSLTKSMLTPLLL